VSEAARSGAAAVAEGTSEQVYLSEISATRKREAVVESIFEEVAQRKGERKEQDSEAIRNGAGLHQSVETSAAAAAEEEEEEALGGSIAEPAFDFMLFAHCPSLLEQLMMPSTFHC
jgi:hypothetical protein